MQFNTAVPSIFADFQHIKNNCKEKLQVSLMKLVRCRRGHKEIFRNFSLFFAENKIWIIFAAASGY